MNHYAIFAIGMFVGMFAGFILLGLLACPRIAELEATVAGLRELLNVRGPASNPTEQLYYNVATQDTEVEG